MEEENIFEDCVFYFPNPDDDHDIYVKKIESAGGFISKILNKRVTHVVSEDGDTDQGQAELVSPDFITECLKKHKKLDEEDFRPNNSNKPKSKKRKTEEPKQSAKWYWQSDNGWVEYEAAVAQRIEKANQNGEDEVKVDKERFVDLTSMLQVRYDDKNKRRPVKRTATGNDKKKQTVDSDEEAGQKVKVIKKGAAAVDPASKYAKNHHVFEEPNCIWDIKLNQTDITNNNNKFYIIQILQPDQGQGYILWTRWGRVGSPGQNKAEYFDSKEQAKKFFKKKFQDKTGNLWEDRKNFEKQPGKYQIVDIDYNEDEEEEEKKTNNNNNQNNKVQKKINIPNSQLDKRLQSLISLICDVRQLNSAMMELEIDIKRMPLGKLSKKQIKKGYEILKEIEELLNGNQKNVHPKLVDCSNRFYTLIPHSFGKKVPPVLNTKKLLQDKMSMLETLADLEIASKILQQGQDLDENPIDTQYKSLHAEMEPLAQDSDEFEMVLAYVERTHAPTHDQYVLSVDEVFKVSREGEEQNFEPWKKIKNRQLLWHGSRLTNWLGIISQGLRIAPPEAPVTGYMFGKGVYFADFVTKSANYCHATKANPTGLLLLCEVALGNMLKKRQAEFINKLPDGYHSCMGEGQWEPNPDQQIELPSGVIVPMGEPKKTDIKDSALLYNEFIVYDTSQVVTRYLVKVTFNFK